MSEMRFMTTQARVNITQLRPASIFELVCCTKGVKISKWYSTTSIKHSFMNSMTFTLRNSYTLCEIIPIVIN